MRTYQENPDRVGVADPPLGFLYFVFMSQPNQNVPVVKDTGSIVIKRVDELCQLGFTMPQDYNYVNAIKASMLALQNVVDRNKRPALEVCTPDSIQRALFKMATRGLSVAKNQAYFIVRGNELCLDDSYFGNTLQVKRIYPNWEPIVNIVYQGDSFEYATDPKTLHKKVIRHEQTLDSLDGDWKAAYMYLPCADGDTDLYIMTKRQILAAWSKSPNGASTAKVFPEKMIRKTIINSGCRMIINSTPDAAQFAPDEDFESEHTPIDLQPHEVQEVNVDAIPVAETTDVAKPQQKNDVPPLPEDVDF